MRQSSALLALAALAACNPPEPATQTDSGAPIGGDSGNGSLDTSATTAPTTSAITTMGAITTASGTTTAPPPPPDPSSSTGNATITITESGPADTTASATTGALTTGEIPDETTGAGPIETWKPKGCPDIYAQNLLPTFELEIEKGELSKLKSEWKAAKNNSPEHSLKSFKFEDTVITNATVQLRGNPLWWPSIGEKMQFEIAFNSVDPNGRFMGQRRLLFDAAHYNESFLRDRLALTILQDVGLPAPCANNARVMLNGKYYGLFTSIEKVDKEFLERRFEDPEGNLYKRNDWEKKNNTEDEDTSDLKTLLAAKTVDQLQGSLKLEEALLEWAAEAVIPDTDGPWAGGLNFYMYNDPKTHFNVIPWDMDATFTRLPFDTDPYVFIKPNDWGRPFYKLATDDPVWFKKYIEMIAYVLEHGYQVDVLQARMDTWAAQIVTAATEDDNKPFSTSDHLAAVQEQRAYIAQRYAYLKTWLECWQNGGTKGKGGQCKPG